MHFFIKNKEVVNLTYIISYQQHVNVVGEMMARKVNYKLLLEVCHLVNLSRIHDLYQQHVQQCCWYKIMDVKVNHCFNKIKTVYKLTFTIFHYLQHWNNVGVKKDIERLITSFNLLKEVVLTFLISSSFFLHSSTDE